MLGRAVDPASPATSITKATAYTAIMIFTIYFIFLTLGDTGLAVDPTTPLYRYWQANGSDHFYTINPDEIGITTPGKVGKFGYTSEGIQCLIYRFQVKNSVPLYRYWRSDLSDHLYTTHAGEMGTTTPGRTGKNDYVSEGIAGFCMPEQTADTIPLYRYYGGMVVDHFYTTSIFEIGTATPGEVGALGYKSEGIQCYVLQA